MPDVTTVMLVRVFGLALVVGVAAGCSAAPSTRRSQSGPQSGPGPTVGPTPGPEAFADECPAARMPATRYEGGPDGAAAKGALCLRTPAGALAEPRVCAEQATAREHDAALQRVVEAHGLTLMQAEATTDDGFGYAGFVGEVVEGLREETAGRHAVAVAVTGGPCSSVAIETTLTTGHLATAADGTLVFVRVAPELAIRSYPFCGCDSGCGQQAPPTVTFVALPEGRQIDRIVEASFPALHVTTHAVDHSCPSAA